MVAETVAMALALLGYATREATSFRAARVLFRSMPELGLLIAHADMPDEPYGGRLLQLAASERPDMPIVVISSRPASELQALPRNAVFLRKPFDRQQLLDAIELGRSVVAAPV